MLHAWRIFQNKDVTMRSGWEGGGHLPHWFCPGGGRGGRVDMHSSVSRLLFLWWILSPFSFFLGRMAVIILPLVSGLKGGIVLGNNRRRFFILQRCCCAPYYQEFIGNFSRNYHLTWSTFAFGGGISLPVWSTLYYSQEVTPRPHGWLPLTTVNN